MSEISRVSRVSLVGETKVKATIKSAVRFFVLAETSYVSNFISGGKEVWEMWRGCKDKFSRETMVRNTTSEAIANRLAYNDDKTVNSIRAAFLAEKFPVIRKLANVQALGYLFQLVKISLESGEINPAWEGGTEGNLERLLNAIVNNLEHSLGDFRVSGKEKKGDIGKRISKAVRTFLGRDVNEKGTKPKDPKVRVKSVKELDVNGRFEFLQLLWAGLSDKERKLWEGFIVRGETPEKKEKAKRKHRKAQRPQVTIGHADDTKLEHEPQNAPQETANV